MMFGVGKDEKLVYSGPALILDGKVCLTSRATVLCHCHANLSSVINLDVNQLP